MSNLRVLLSMESGRTSGNVTHDPDNGRWIAYLNRTDEVAIFTSPEGALGYIYRAMAAEAAQPKPKPTVIG